MAPQLARVSSHALRRPRRERDIARTGSPARSQLFPPGVRGRTLRLARNRLRSSSAQSSGSDVVAALVVSSNVQVQLGGDVASSWTSSLVCSPLCQPVGSNPARRMAAHADTCSSRTARSPQLLGFLGVTPELVGVADPFVAGFAAPFADGAVEAGVGGVDA